MRKRIGSYVAVTLCAAMILGGCAAPAAPEEEAVQSPEPAETAATEDGAEDSAEDMAQEAEKPEEEKTFAELFPDVDISDLPTCDPKDYPVVDGSTANLPLSYAIYQAVTGATLGEAKEKITCTKTDYSYYSILGDYDGAASLLLVYEPSEEIEEYIQEADTKILRKPIGKDALVFLENEGNPVTSLTEQQLIDIYSGRITNWKNVGGDASEIKAFQRSQNSGSQTLMEKLVMRGTKMMDAPAYMVPSEMGDLIEDVAYYNNAQNALGYSVYFYARNMYSFPGLRFLSVNGVAPSNKTIGNGDYPYVNDFYGVIREDEPEDSIAHQIYDWLTEEDGQSLVRACGYVPLDGSSVERSPITLEEMEKGDVTFDLAPGTYIVLDGRDAMGQDGITIFDGSLQAVKHLDGLAAEEVMSVRRLDEPVQMRDTQTGLTGLYDLEGEKWLVEPEYNNVEWDEQRKLWELSIYDYDYETDVDHSAFYTWADGKKTKVDGGSFYTEALGDELWTVNDTDLTVTVNDKNGKFLRTINLEDYDIDYGYVSGGWFIGNNYDTDNTTIYDKDMNKVFSIDSLGADLYTVLGVPEGDASIQNPRVYLYGADPDGRMFMGNAYANDDDRAHYFLYDLKEHKLLSKSGDHVSSDTLHHGRELLYRCNDEDETDVRIYNAKGELVTAKDGTPFQFVAGWRYLGYVDPNDPKVLILESDDGREHYTLRPSEMSSDNWAPVRAVGPHLFVIYGDASSSLWDGEECILDDGYVTSWALGEEDPEAEDGNGYPYIFVQGSTATTILFEAKTGEELWKTKELVNVQNIAGPVLYATEGAYTELMTIDGQVALKMLSGNTRD